jgi:hypothetical protein
MEIVKKAEENKEENKCVERERSHAAAMFL